MGKSHTQEKFKDENRVIRHRISKDQFFCINDQKKKDTH